MRGKDEYANRTQMRIKNILLKNERYLTDYYNFIGMNKTLETKYGYILVVQMFMNKANKNISNLTMNDFTYYISDIYANSSASHAIKTYAALKLFGKFLYASKMLEDNPMIYVERPKFSETDETVRKRENGYLTKKEVKQLMSSIREGAGSGRARRKQEKFKNRDLLICSLFLVTGIRCSALGKIDISDIDAESRILYVNDKGNKVNKYELPENIFPIIEDWLTDRENILDGVDVEALFVSERKQRMAQNSISAVVKKYSQDIEGKHITPHKLRATYGTQVYEATHDVYYTQQCMHHNSPKTTELYIRGNANRTRQASDIMSKIALQ